MPDSELFINDVSARISSLNGFFPTKCFGYNSCQKEKFNMLDVLDDIFVPAEFSITVCS